MKKFYAIALFVLTAMGAFAQKGEITGMVEKNIQQMPSISAKTTGVIDTLTDYIARSTNFYILTAGASGYVFGTNNLTYETGMHYDAQGAAATITELMVYFVHKNITGTTDIMTAGAYMVNQDSTPNGSAVATGTFSLDDVDTTGLPTFIMLPNGTGLVTGEFMVTINYDPTAFDDTLVILANNPTGDGAGERRAYQRTTQGWLAAADIWTFGGNPLDGDAIICPIVDVVPVGIEDGITTQGLTLKAHYPNPATDFVNIPYALDRTRTVSISVFDQTGRILADTGTLTKEAGDHQAVINVSNWAAGKYYFRVSSEGAQWTSRFVVVK